MVQNLPLDKSLLAVPGLSPSMMLLPRLSTTPSLKLRQTWTPRGGGVTDYGKCLGGNQPFALKPNCTLSLWFQGQLASLPITH